MSPLVAHEVLKLSPLAYALHIARLTSFTESGNLSAFRF